MPALSRAKSDSDLKRASMPGASVQPLAGEPARVLTIHWELVAYSKKVVVGASLGLTLPDKVAVVPPIPVAARVVTLGKR